MTRCKTVMLTEQQFEVTHTRRGRVERVVKTWRSWAAWCDDECGATVVTGRVGDPGARARARDAARHENAHHAAAS